ncbi:hypothetical protein EG68_05407 [Paragonimus skrjabini miyazakii]|uniref:Ig-like domain-containing protein n=1 Tax=Paragonimus skrjabini miyazakii TaxID=59628 RepID=A0A8S9YX12_9TREM|nr:hypothetical protein EG68_05407 [Paragonimus skrjabini miyazakii]
MTDFSMLQMKRLLIWISLLALHKLPVVVSKYENFFLGFDIELPPETYTCSEKDRLIRDPLKPFSNSCKHLDEKTLPRLLDPNAIEAKFEWRNYTQFDPLRFDGYFVKYCVKNTKETLKETPTVQLHNPEIKPLASTEENAIHITSYLFGHFYILLLDAFHPKFLRFQAPGDDQELPEQMPTWERWPKSFEVFYSFSDPFYSGMQITPPSVCTTLGSPVQLFQSVLEIACVTVKEGYEFNYVFQAQFNHAENVYYSPPYPQYINLADSVYLHGFSILPHKECMLSTLIKIRREDRYEIRCYSKIVQTFYAFNFSRLTFKQFGHLQYVLETSTFELDIRHPTVDIPELQTECPKQCFDLRPRLAVPIKQFVTQPGFNKVACYMVLGKHQHVVTKELIHMTEKHQEILVLQGEDQINVRDLSRNDEPFEIKLYFAAKRLHSADFILCEGLRYDYPWIYFDGISDVGPVNVTCFIPAQEKLFQKTLTFNITGVYKFVIKPFRVIVCRKEPVKFHCTALTSVGRGSTTKWMIEEDGSKVFESGSEIHHSVSSASRLFRLTCYMDLFEDQKLQMTMGVTDPEELRLILQPKGIKYYVPSIRKLLTVDPEQKNLTSDETWVLKLSIPPEKETCVPGQQSPTKPNAMTVTAYVKLGECRPITRVYELLCPAEKVKLRVVPSQTYLYYDRPTTKMIFKCELTIPDEALFEALQVAWRIDDDARSYFRQSHGYLYGTNETRSGSYEFWCNSSVDSSLAVKHLFNIVYGSDIDLTLSQPVRDRPFIELSQEANYECIIKKRRKFRNNAWVANIHAFARPEEKDIEVSGSSVIHHPSTVEKIVNIGCLLLRLTPILKTSTRIPVLDIKNLRVELPKQTTYNVSIKQPVQCQWTSLLLQKEKLFPPKIFSSSFENVKTADGVVNFYPSRPGDHRLICVGVIGDVRREDFQEIHVSPAPEVSLIVEPNYSTFELFEPVPKHTCRVDTTDWSGQKPIWYAVDGSPHITINGSELIHEYSDSEIPGQYTYLCMLSTDFGHYTYLLPLIRFRKRMSIVLEPPTRSLQNEVWYTCASKDEPVALKSLTAEVIEGPLGKLDYSSDRAAFRFHQSNYSQMPVRVRCSCILTFMDQVLSNRFVDILGDSYEPNPLSFHPNRTQFYYGQSIECRAADFVVADFELQMEILSQPEGNPPVKTGIGILFFDVDLLGGRYSLACLLIENGVTVALTEMVVHLIAKPQRLIPSRRVVHLPGEIECLTNGYPVDPVNISWRLVDGPTEVSLLTTQQHLKFTNLSAVGKFIVECKFEGIYDSQPFHLSQNLTIITTGAQFNLCDRFPHHKSHLSVFTITSTMLFSATALMLAFTIILFVCSVTKNELEAEHISIQQLRSSKYNRTTYVNIGPEDTTQNEFLKLLQAIVLFDQVKLNEQLAEASQKVGQTRQNPSVSGDNKKE